MARLALIAIAVLCTITSCYGYFNYQSNIPNGNRVPDPCSNSDGLWAGVGHQRSQGAGARNPFGTAFAAAGHTWSVTFCQADSDGDGMTNGEELGDPDCVWVKGGAAPNRTTGLTHPGICTPLNSAKCCGKQSWLSCGVACATASQGATQTSTVPATTPAAVTTATNGASKTFVYYSIFYIIPLMIYFLR